MTLPASGTLSFSQVNAELGRSGAQALDMNDGGFRNLAGVSSGQIGMSSLRGKSSYTPMTLNASGGQGTSGSSQTSGGSVGAQASASVSGGSGGYTYQWTVNSNPSGCTISGLTANYVNASKSFPKLANGQASVILTVVVTDNTGHQVSQGGIEIDLYWGTQQ